MRRSRLFLLFSAILLVGGLSLQPAQANTVSGKILAQSDWSYLTWADYGLTGVAPFPGQTGKGFAAACMADRSALANGQSAHHIDDFLAGPLNGFDALVVKLATPFKGSGNFEVVGPDPGDPIVLVPRPYYPTDLNSIPGYDTDLDFVSAPSATQATRVVGNLPGGGCGDANPSEPGRPCFGHKAQPQEHVTCVLGDRDGAKASYVVVSLTLNRTQHIPFHFNLLTP